MDFAIIKYPRTPHIEGSRLQPGDEDLTQVPFEQIAGRHIVVEEKIDGANSAVSFDGEGNLLLQSRGRYLTGGWRERHYDLLKQWSGAHRAALYDVLGSRYIMYGEWMYAKHTVYYDALPHYFMEFDVLDRETGRFLDTASRHALLAPLPVAHVPVLFEGEMRSKDELLGLIGPSKYITARHLQSLRKTAEREGLDAELVISQTDESGIMEGIYIKIEEGGEVAGRVKYVRLGFVQAIAESETHWLNRPIVPNGLACALDDLFAPELPGKDEKE